MGYLIIGIGFFAGLHAFSMLLPQQRDALKVNLGEGPYKGLYSLISLAGLALMIWGFWSLTSDPLAGSIVYQPAPWTRHVTMLLVLLGFISLSGFHGKGYMKQWLRNPFSVGIVLWSVGHLLSNGMLHDVLLFGTFLVLAALDIILSTVRGKRPGHDPQIGSDMKAVVAGVALYAIFLFGVHPYVFNVPIV
ncbi:MAG: NnrU family protein [Hyphomicrobiales bacterium]|nr:NnrU family protein [Hyphomicrobiales bacterium]HQX84677.1 NnrU family protein [Aestuariivirga sp.]